MITVEDLSFSYDNKEILRDINFTANKGELTVIVGPNGCGKSTLLKLMAKILTPNSGQILVDDPDTSTSLWPQLVAYLPQGRNIPEITAERLVLHGRFPYLSYPRKYSKSDYEKVREALDRVGAGSLAQEPMSQLSGGQRQKIYIAMALAQDTPIILMDEPTTYLDIANQLELMELARELVACGKTIIMVLHDSMLAFKFADSIVVMNGGRIVCKKGPKELWDSGELDEVMGVEMKEVLHIF